MNSEGMKEKYKERLKKILGKKIETTMIYPLSQFESEFGELWGDKLPEAELTEEQKVWRKKYNLCRDNILNLGNTQKRNLNAEIDMHEVIWKRFQYTLTPVKK